MKESWRQAVGWTLWSYKCLDIVTVMKNYEQSLHLHFNVNITGIVPTWNNLYFIFKAVYIICSWRSHRVSSSVLYEKQPWCFCPCRLNRYFNIFNIYIYMYTIYEMAIIFVIWNVWIVCGKFCAVLQNGLSKVWNPAGQAELHWPRTKIMWCHFNLNLGAFYFPLHAASFAPQPPGIVWGRPKPCYSGRYWF